MTPVRGDVLLNVEETCHETPCRPFLTNGGSRRLVRRFGDLIESEVLFPFIEGFEVPGVLERFDTVSLSQARGCGYLHSVEPGRISVEGMRGFPPMLGCLL